MTSTSCTVCFEEYSKSGERVPKLLPCTHTLCTQCLQRLIKGTTVRCPECRKAHTVSIGGVRAFPTNRYVLEVLEMLELVQKQDAKREQEATPLAEDETPVHHNPVVLCETHSLPCVMFCFDAGCERALCAACPLAEHVGHVMRGLQENMADAQEIRQMEQQLSAHRNSLDEFAVKILKNKTMVLKAAEDAEAEIDQKVNEVIGEAEALKQRIEQASNEHLERLDAIQYEVYKCTTEGTHVSEELAECPRAVLEECLQPLCHVMQRVAVFQQRADAHLRKDISCDVSGFRQGVLQLGQPKRPGVSTRGLFRPRARPEANLSSEQGTRPQFWNTLRDALAQLQDDSTESSSNQEPEDGVDPPRPLMGDNHEGQPGTQSTEQRPATTQGLPAEEDVLSNQGQVTTQAETPDQGTTRSQPGPPAPEERVSQPRGVLPTPRIPRSQPVEPPVLAGGATAVGQGQPTQAPPLRLIPPSWPPIICAPLNMGREPPSQARNSRVDVRTQAGQATTSGGVQPRGHPGVAEALRALVLGRDQGQLSRADALRPDDYDTRPRNVYRPRPQPPGPSRADSDPCWRKK